MYVLEIEIWIRAVKTLPLVLEEVENIKKYPWVVL